jgi:hypothetical protein
MTPHRRLAATALALPLLLGAARSGAPQEALERGLASTPGTAADGQDLLDFCTTNAGRCAISVYDVAGDRMGHLFPDRPQVLASTSKILFLLGYAQAVAAGAIDPTDTLTKEEWARYLTLDGFALKASWEDLGKPDTVTWNDLARMMVLHSDNATPDHLDAILGAKRVKNARKLFKGFHDIPLPISAIFGLWTDGGGVGGEARRIAESYGSIATAGYRKEARDMFAALDKAGPLATYRKSLCVTPPWKSLEACDPPAPSATTVQRQFMSRNHFTRSTTRTYMKLMAALLAGTIMKDSERAIVRPILEIWLEVFPTLSPAFSRYGLKGGSLAVGAEGLDILTWATYMRTGAGSDYVVAVFLQGLSEVKSPPGAADVNSFAQQFALTPAFRETVLAALAADDARPELVPQILKIKAKGAKRSARRGKITVKVRAENASPNAATSTVMRLYLSDDNELDAGDTLLAQKTVPGLKAYKGKSASLKGTAGSTAGKYLILALDDDAAVGEQDEDNNIVWERVR